MKELSLAFVTGIIFALGLGVSGMTNPEKIMGFLDFAGDWDPSLAFVMVGAIGVHIGFAQWALRATRPRWATSFAFPRRMTVDSDLLTGAAIFGLGWGAAGYCPGPAIVDVVVPSRNRIAFVLAMLAGVLVFRGLAARRHPLRSRPQQSGATLL